MRTQAHRAGRGIARRNRRERVNRTRLRLELLEDRSLPSAGAGAFSYQLLASLGDAAPGGGTYVFDFEPYGLNNQGQALYAADLSAGGEGIFLRNANGETTALARSGDPAPGTTGVFGPAFPGPGLTLNDSGDAGFPFFIGDPISGDRPAGIFRFSHLTGTVTAVAVPGTPMPGGGVFAGTPLHPSLNRRGDLAFAGLVTEADIAPGPPGIDGTGLGGGVFLQTKNGQLSSVLRPGAAAPGGGVFDFIESPSLNDRGEMAFGAHVQGEECITGSPQTDRIFCSESVYLKETDGDIISIAHQGQGIPDSAGGGTYRLAFGPILNNKGQMVFIGDLTAPPGRGQALGVFFWEDGHTVAVARPGDAMPGGGTLVTASFFQSTYDLNEVGKVTFAGSLDTDGDGVSDATGVFVWSAGVLKVIARTGTEIPGLGTVTQILPPDLAGCFPGCFPYAFLSSAMNERGQVLFTAALDDGSGVLLVASPTGAGGGGAAAAAGSTSGNLLPALASWVAGQHGGVSAGTPSTPGSAGSVVTDVIDRFFADLSVGLRQNSVLSSSPASGSVHGGLGGSADFVPGGLADQLLAGLGVTGL